MENDGKIPSHVAIIMDGNGRWAKKRGLERVEGHRAGAVAVKNLVENLKGKGIRYLTLYAFSTENWKRSKEEVDALMELLCEFIDANLDLIVEKEIRLLVMGRMHGLPENVQKKLRNAIQATSKNKGETLIFALNYGGRAEIADAARQIAKDVLKGKVKPDDVDEALFGRYLYLPDVPDPDLLIRTSGELRLSNFLLWSLSYSEIYVTDILWPDFDIAELDKAIDDFQKRNRRYGGR